MRPWYQAWLRRSVLLSLSSSSSSLCSFSGDESRMYFSLENWAETARVGGQSEALFLPPRPILHQGNPFHPGTPGTLRHRCQPGLPPGTYPGRSKEISVNSTKPCLLCCVPCARCHGQVSEAMNKPGYVLQEAPRPRGEKPPEHLSRLRSAPQSWTAAKSAGFQDYEVPAGWRGRGGLHGRDGDNKTLVVHQGQPADLEVAGGGVGGEFYG